MVEDAREHERVGSRAGLRAQHRIALAAGLAILLCLSVVATFKDPLRSCQGCGTARRALPAAPIGIAGYAVLLALTAVRRADRPLGVGVALAFGTHAFLAGNLIVGGVWCWLCLAAAALSAAVFVVFVHASVMHLLWTAGTSVLTLLALQAFTPIAFPLVHPSRTLAHVDASEFHSDASQTTILVLERPDSERAGYFAANIAPLIVSEFGERVRIRYRELPPQLQWNPAVVIGRERRTATVILGHMDYASVRGRVLSAMASK